MLDRLQTKDNLLSRQCIANDGSLCSLCNSHPETASHLFFSCTVSYRVWNDSYSWLGFSSVFPKDPVSHFYLHTGMVKGKKRKKVWLVIWLSTVWII